MSEIFLTRLLATKVK